MSRSSPASPAQGPRPLDLRRAIIAISGIFLLDGFLFGGWTSRLPAVQRSIHASDATLGIALLGVAIGALTAMPIAGAICRSQPPERLACATLVATCGTLALPGLAHSPWVLLLVLVVFGATYGATDVAMNSAAVRLAARSGRPILPRFHALFSLGALAGALGGSLAGWLRIPVEGHLLVASGLALAGAVPCVILLDLRGARAPEPRPRADAPHAARPAWRHPGVLAAAAMCGGAAFSESGVAGWGAIHLQHTVAASATVAPLGFAVCSVVETLSRFGGTAAVERLGARRFAMLSAALAVVGLGLVLVHSLPVALIGYGTVGLGLASLFPLGIARAGEIRGSTGVATASFVGYACFLLGAPLIGVLAGPLGLSVALASGIVVAVLLIDLGRRLPAA